MLKPGQQTYFSWDDPTVNCSTISVLIGQAENDENAEGGQKTVKYEINVNKLEQQNISFQKKTILVETVEEVDIKVYKFSKQEKAVNTGIQTSWELDVSLRIGVISNIFSPNMHLMDLTTGLHLDHDFGSQGWKLAVNCTRFQIDNQSKYRCYFPVVLSTEWKVLVCKKKNITLELYCKNIKVCIQEDFALSIMNFLEQMQSIIGTQSSKNSFFICKIQLPRLVVDLQIQTRSLSIETTVNLEAPPATSYPWSVFPYPIRSIAFKILSHLSISPWAFISSFGKGIASLLSEEETSKGVEGFFQQVIGGVSNTLSGVLGVLVGHDIERVDDFIDGLDKGVILLGRELYEIVPCWSQMQSIESGTRVLARSALNLVIKPVTGLLRMSLKISEGIKKTVLFSFDSPLTRKSRCPIVFFAREEYFIAYHLETSRLIEKLHKCANFQLKYFYLVQLFRLSSPQNPDLVLAVGTQRTVLFSLREEAILWDIALTAIKDIDVKHTFTLVFIVLPLEQHCPVKYEFQIADQQLIHQIIQTITHLKKNSFPSCLI